MTFFAKMTSATTPCHTVFCRRLYAYRPSSDKEEPNKSHFPFKLFKTMPHSRFKVGSHRKNAKTGGDDHNRSGAHRRAHSARADGRRTPETLHTRHICIIGTFYATLTPPLLSAALMRPPPRTFCARRRAPYPHPQKNKDTK